MSHGNHDPRSTGSSSDDGDEDLAALLPRGAALSVLWLDEADDAPREDDEHDAPATK
jgi:hypothetical protein